MKPVKTKTNIYTKNRSDIMLSYDEFQYHNFIDDPQDAHIVLAYGGDGTMIKTFRDLVKAEMHDQVLLAGLNKGTVGFMANDMDDLDFLDAVIQAYDKGMVGGSVQNRSLLNINTVDNKECGKHILALNEIVIQPRDRGKLFDCYLIINIPSIGVLEEVIKYSGDGVIISTASGSTAYNLSAGGPMLTPNDKSIIITPICPFTMAGRSIILPPDAMIEIKSEYLDYVCIDGIPEAGSNKRIYVENSTDTLMLFKQDSFFNTIQNKLGWNKAIK